MSRLLVASNLLILLMATQVVAGPNEGVVLVVHGQGEITGSTWCSSFSIPETCTQLDTQTYPSPYYGQHAYFFLVLAAFPESASPDFNVVYFGLGDYDASSLYIDEAAPYFPELVSVEVPGPGWPGPNTGTGVSWAPNCLRSPLVPIYCFMAYAPDDYGEIPLAPHPSEPSVVLSCDDPAEEDEIAAFGVIGIGHPGYNPCPGTSSVEDPESDTMTWGRIKVMY